MSDSLLDRANKGILGLKPYEPGKPIEETQKEDLDARTHGDLFHKIHHNLLLETLRFQEGESRDIRSVLNKKEPINISESNTFWKRIISEDLMLKLT